MEKLQLNTQNENKKEKSFKHFREVFATKQTWKWNSKVQELSEKKLEIFRADCRASCISSIMLYFKMINHQGDEHSVDERRIYFFHKLSLTLCLFISNKFKLPTENIITMEYIMFTLESINAFLDAFCKNCTARRKQWETNKNRLEFVSFLPRLLSEKEKY